MAEGAFLRKIPWTRKPERRTKINFSHPLSKGLIQAYYFDGTGNVEIYNAAKEVSTGVAPSGSDFSYARHRGEKSASFDGTSGATPIPAGSEISVGSGFSIVGRIAFNAYTTDQALCGFGGFNQRVQFWRDEFASGDRFGFLVQNSSAANQIAYSSSSTAPTDNRFTTLVATTNATTAASGTHRLYVNGIADGTASGDLHSDFSSITVEVGSVDGEAGKKLNGYIGLFYIYDRELSSYEAKSISDNPYQILQPRTQYIPYTVPAATVTGMFTRKIPWKTKPDYPVTINQSNPLAKGLKYLHLYNNGNGVVKDLAGNLDLAVNNATTTVVTGADGKSLDYSPASAYALAASSGDILGGYPFTVSALVNLDGISFSTEMPIISHTDYTASSTWAFSVQLHDNGTGTGLYARCVVRNIVYRPITGSVDLLAAGGTHLISFVCVSATERYMYVDGVLDGTDTNSSTYPSTLNTVQTGYIARNSSYTAIGKFDGVLIGTAIHNRALSATEVRLLNDNFYQLLQPRTQYIPYTVPAATVTGMFTRKIPWTRKPAHAVIVNQSHPFSEGKNYGAWLAPHKGSLGGLRNAIDLSNITDFSKGAWHTLDATSGQPIVINNNDGAIHPSEFTWIFNITFTNKPGANKNIFSTKSVYNGSTGLLASGKNNSTGTFILWVAGATSADTGYIPLEGVNTTLIFTYNGTTLKMFASDGVFGNKGLVYSGAQTINASTTNLAVGGDNSNQDINGATHLIATRQGAIPDTLAYSLLDNPYQLFSRTQYIPYSTAAAGGGGRIMSSLAAYGGLAGHGGLAGKGGGLAG